MARPRNFKDLLDRIPGAKQSGSAVGGWTAPCPLPGHRISAGHLTLRDAGDISIPDPLVSDRQYLRFHHLDLSEMEDSKLLGEYHYLRSHLWDLPDDHWPHERVRMLETELIKRRGHIRDELRGRPKPKPAEGVEL